MIPEILFAGQSSLNKIQWSPLNNHLILEIYILTNFYSIINLFINVKPELGSGKNPQQFNHKNEIGANYL